MGDESPPPPPAPVIIQPPQPVTQTASESADAQVEAFKKLIPLLPQYAQTLTDIQNTQAPQLSQSNLDQQKTYGPQLIQAALDNLKIADPTGLATRNALGQRVLSGLSDDQFGKLSPNEVRQAEQDVRAAQVSRGGGTGLGDSIQEAIQKYNLGNSRQQQQLSNAGSFLAGTPPQGNFAALNQAGQTAPVGTQNVQGFSSQLFPSTNALISNQAQNYNTYSGFATGLNNYNLGVANYNQQYSDNPFLTGISAAATIAGKVAPLAAMCWVAEEIWGKNAEKTHRVRGYVRKHAGDLTALGDFCRRYAAHGKDWAKNIKVDMASRLEAERVWGELDEQATKELALV